MGSDERMHLKSATEEDAMRKALLDLDRGGRPLFQQEDRQAAPGGLV